MVVGGVSVLRAVRFNRCRGGQGEQSLQYPDRDSGGGVPAVPFEIELGFEGVEDRIDGLAEWFEKLPA